MIVFVNDEKHHFNGESLRLLGNLRVFSIPQGGEAGSRLLHTLGREATREREGHWQGPCGLDDDYDAEAPLRVFITKNDAETVLYRGSFGGQALAALRASQYQTPTPVVCAGEAWPPVERLMQALGAGPGDF